MNREYTWSLLALMVTVVAITTYGWLCAVTELQSVTLPIPPTDRILCLHRSTCESCGHLGKDGVRTKCDEACRISMAIYSGNENFKYYELDGWHYVGLPIKYGWSWSIKHQRWIQK